MCQIHEWLELIKHMLNGTASTSFDQWQFISLTGGLNKVIAHRLQKYIYYQ